MATQVQFRRGTTAETAAFIGADSEVTVDTTKKTCVVHDGSQLGGYPLLREDGSNSALLPGSLSSCSLKFVNDPNTGIISPSSDQISLVTGGVSRLLVDSSGSVSIPGNIIVGGSFSGAISFNDGTASSPSIKFLNSPDTGFYSPGTKQVAISTNGSGRLFVGSTGNIAIGTSAAVDSSGYGTTLDIRGSGTGNGAVIYLRNSDASVTGQIAAYGDGRMDLGTTTNHPLKFFTNNSEKVRITAAGLVGIGTSAPTENLTIYGTSSRFAVTGGAGSSAILIGNQNGSGANNPSVIEAANGALYFGGGNSWSGGGTFDYTMTLTNDNKVGIGSSTPGAKLEINSGGGTSVDSQLITSTSSCYSYCYSSAATGSSFYGLSNASTAGLQTFSSAITFGTYHSYPIVFGTANAERARIDSSGRLLVGTSSSITNALEGGVQIVGTAADAYLTLTRFGGATASAPAGIILGRSRSGTKGTNTAVSDGDFLGVVEFTGADGGSSYRSAAQIGAYVDGAVSGGGAADMPARLVFSTTADGASSPTERMRITSTGAALIGSLSVSDGERLKVENSGAGNSAAYFVYASSDDRAVVMSYHAGSTGATSRKHYEFRNSGGNAVGSISATGTATAYNTSSDYRLKENVASVTDGITRLQQLKPSRFNFIADPDRTVDGFIAHEVQTVVPEAITGEKDAVDDDGNPVYQGIDQSKLVPLLTAALQEAIGEIESLKARVAALETA